MEKIKILILMTLITVVLGGCAGLEIKPISTEEAKKHIGSGYTIYEPMLAYPIMAELKDGNCKLSIGDRLLIQNHDKPYRVQSKTGLGQSDVTVNLTDGWILGSFTDKSNNTEILKVLSSAAGIAAGFDEKANCLEKSGIYSINFSNGEFVTQKIALPF